MNEPVNIGVVIALAEEFGEFYRAFASPPQSEPYDGFTFYRFDYKSADGRVTYRIHTAFIGAMGNDKCALLTDRLINRYGADLVVMLGIAGGMHRDVKLGDVVVAAQVDKFIDSGKAVGGGPFRIAFGGEAYRATEALLNTLRNFEFASSDLFVTWQKGCAERLAREVDASAQAQLRSANVLGTVARLHEVHLAASPVVAASKEFVDWLHTRDRNLKAIDMESGGLMLAAHSQSEPTRTLVLRGISDLADERKQKMDEIGQGGLRRCAMQNATALLLTLLSAGAFAGRKEPGGTIPTVEHPDKGQTGADKGGSTQKVKEFLFKVLPTDSDFEGFCQDYFNETRRRFSSGMERTAKMNLLLDRHSIDEVLSALKEAEPARFARFKNLLE